MASFIVDIGDSYGNIGLCRYLIETAFETFYFLACAFRGHYYRNVFLSVESLDSFVNHVIVAVAADNGQCTEVSQKMSQREYEELFFNEETAIEP